MNMDKVRHIAAKAQAARRFFDGHDMLAAEVTNRMHLEDLECLLAENKRLWVENEEMRRTFGSHPLFAERDAEIKRLRALLQLCVDVLDSKEMQSVFTFLYVHGREYKGPTIPMDEIRRALADSGHMDAAQGAASNNSQQRN